MRNFKIYSLRNLQMYNAILLIIVLMLYMTYLSYNWMFVPSDHHHPFPFPLPLTSGNPPSVLCFCEFGIFRLRM